jgi:uncharacterized membrane protein
MTGAVAVAFWWLVFSGSHLALSSLPVRAPLVRRLGQRGFQGLYSLVALATFIAWVNAWWGARGSGAWLWTLREVPGLRELAIALALLGSVFVFLGLLQPSPTGMLPGAPARAHGVTRITRHSLFTGFSLWGIAHCLVNGRAPDVLFFGGLALFSLVGALHQDARKRAAQGERLAAFYAETSLLPFAAILAGRQRLALGELSWPAVALGTAAGIGLYLTHDALFRG